jgi:hypothetical protein
MAKRKRTKGQITQWPKEKGLKDRQRSPNHTHKTKDRVTRTSLKTRDELRFSRYHITITYNLPHLQL